MNNKQMAKEFLKSYYKKYFEAKLSGHDLTAEIHLTRLKGVLDTYIHFDILNIAETDLVRLEALKEVQCTQ